MINNSPLQIPMTIFQGADYVRNFYYQNNGVPNNITGYTAKMEGRQTTNSSDPAIFEADTTNYLTISGTLGQVSLTFPAAYTVALPIISNGVWDLFIYGPGGEPVVRLVGGIFNINESVTRP